MYHCREQGVHWDRYKGGGRWIIDRNGHLRMFEYPQVADVFVYCCKHHGVPLANQVANSLEAKLATTLASFVKDSLVAEIKGNAKDALRDYLLGVAKLPVIPGPVGLAQKVIEAAATALGEGYLQGQVANHKRSGLYTCDFSPASGVDAYCNYVISSWVEDPVNGPYYTVYAPDLRNNRPR